MPLEIAEKNSLQRQINLLRVALVAMALLLSLQGSAPARAGLERQAVVSCWGFTWWLAVGGSGMVEFADRPRALLNIPAPVARFVSLGCLSWSPLLPT
jgi:hypothetical protein